MAPRLCALLLLLPALVRAHGSEFLGAKLQVLPGRELLMEITADYGDNPMIQDRAEAEVAIQGLLEARWSVQSKPLADLAPLALEERSQPDRSSPLPTDESGSSHQLLTAVWRWQVPPEVKELRFGVPKNVQHSTVFWLEEPGVPREKKKWSMLLSGDSTPPVPLPDIAADSPSWMAFTAIICISLTLVMLLRRYRTLFS